MTLAKTVKFKTPTIPGWIKALELSGYKNSYSYELGNKNLWGTETLFGDWEGRYLLIAQDFSPTRFIEERIKDGETHPYRHNPNAPTNKNLIKTLRHFGRLAVGFENVSCGFLYVSACFLLRGDGKKRGNLRTRRAVLRVSSPVLQFTISQMPNLERIVCMGKVAAEAMAHGMVGSALPSVSKVSHPANAMTDASRFDEWMQVFSERIQKT